MERAQTHVQTSPATATSDPISTAGVPEDGDTYYDYVNASFMEETRAATGQTPPPRKTIANADITVALLPDRGTKHSSFKGKKNVLPGVLLLVFLFALGFAGLTYFGVERFRQMQKERDFKFSKSKKVVAPPKPLVCGLPNYRVKKTQLEMISPDGKRTKSLRLAGVNWQGMNFEGGVPHGLAFGQQDIYSIAKELRNNSFNAVRLQLSAMHIFNNDKPDLRTFVDPDANVFLSAATNYLELLQEVVKALGTQRLGVVLDIHNINPAATNAEDLWFSSKFPVSKYNTVVKKLAKSLCSTKYWNVIGIDLNNEPAGGCWPGNAKASCSASRNWPNVAGMLAKTMLDVCPGWLAFVQGVGLKKQEIELNGRTHYYNDWRGGSTANVETTPVAVKGYKNKVVYAPHFHSPSVYPQSYFFQAASSTNNTFVEFEATKAGDNALLKNTFAVMDKMLGVTSLQKHAFVMGEFAGIYGEEDAGLHRTSTRVLDYILQYMNKHDFAGGFMWALNPNNHFNYNGVYNDRLGFSYGLYSAEWKSIHKDYTKALSKLKGSGPLPCYDEA